jgi:hypothetical protein
MSYMKEYQSIVIRVCHPSGTTGQIYTGKKYCFENWRNKPLSSEIVGKTVNLKKWHVLISLSNAKIEDVKPQVIHQSKKWHHLQFCRVKYMCNAQLDWESVVSLERCLFSNVSLEGYFISEFVNVNSILLISIAFRFIVLLLCKSIKFIDLV